MDAPSLTSSTKKPIVYRPCLGEVWGWSRGGPFECSPGLNSPPELCFHGTFGLRGPGGRSGCGKTRTSSGTRSPGGGRHWPHARPAGFGCTCPRSLGRSRLRPGSARLRWLDRECSLHIACLKAGQPQRVQVGRRPRCSPLARAPIALRLSCRDLRASSRRAPRARAHARAHPPRGRGCRSPGPAPNGSQRPLWWPGRRRACGPLAGGRAVRGGLVLGGRPRLEVKGARSLALRCGSCLWFPHSDCARLKCGGSMPAASR